jgi:hypothetical protein
LYASHASFLVYSPLGLKGESSGCSLWILPFR